MRFNTRNNKITNMGLSIVVMIIGIILIIGWLPAMIYSETYSKKHIDILNDLNKNGLNYIKLSPCDFTLENNDTLSKLSNNILTIDDLKNELNKTQKHYYLRWTQTYTTYPVATTASTTTATAASTTTTTATASTTAAPKPEIISFTEVFYKGRIDEAIYTDLSLKKPGINLNLSLSINDKQYTNFMLYRIPNDYNIIIVEYDNKISIHGIQVKNKYEYGKVDDITKKQLLDAVIKEKTNETMPRWGLRLLVGLMLFLGVMLIVSPLQTLSNILGSTPFIGYFISLPTSIGLGIYYLISGISSILLTIMMTFFVWCYINNYLIYAGIIGTVITAILGGIFYKVKHK